MAYSICNVRFKRFRFHIGQFDFRLNSHRIVHRAMLLSVAVTSASSKTNAVGLTLNLLPKLIYALSFNSHHVYHIFTKTISTSPSLPVMQFDNENLNVILSRFDGSRNVPKRNGKLRRATEICKKKEVGCSFCSPPLFES